jgi:hypothetical protein
MVILKKDETYCLTIIISIKEKVDYINYHQNINKITIVYHNILYEINKVGKTSHWNHQWRLSVIEHRKQIN